MDNPQTTYFKYDGVFWLMFYRGENVNGDTIWDATGPYCGKCKVEMDKPIVNIAVCPNKDCKFSKTFDKRIDSVTYDVVRLFEAKQRENFQIISLDLPAGMLADRDEDENYWIEARIGQYKGVKTGLVYFGDKSKKDGKVQLFIDLEANEARFHSKDRHPSEIASKVTIEFPLVKQTYTKRVSG